MRLPGLESDEELVLKVAIDYAHADRIRAEAAGSPRLHHQNIVRFVADITVPGRRAILMERAGDRTIAQWICGVMRFRTRTARDDQCRHPTIF